MKVFMLLGFLFVCEDMRAQIRKITGIVRDVYSGEFLSSASIAITGVHGGQLQMPTVPLRAWCRIINL